MELWFTYGLTIFICTLILSGVRKDNINPDGTLINLSVLFMILGPISIIPASIIIKANKS